mgnify:CR=1 FL=1
MNVKARAAGSVPFVLLEADSSAREVVSRMSNVIDRVTSMVSPILADLSLELYDLDFAGGVLKVTIDTPPGSPAGVDIDQIALVTRLLGRELDHDENAVPGRFTLEVTSPGLERTLRTPAHFQREVGKTVAIRLRDIAGDARRVQGVLVAADDTTDDDERDHEAKRALEQRLQASDPLVPPGRAERIASQDTRLARQALAAITTLPLAVSPVSKVLRKCSACRRFLPNRCG